jgi:putative ABC transport system permease protein
MVPLARRNLMAERARMGMAVAGVAFAVLLVLLVVALYRGWSGIGGLFGGYPGEVWVAQRGTSDPLHSASSLAGDRVDELSRIPGVRAAMPVYVRQMAVREKGAEAVRPYFMAIDAPRDLPLPAATRSRLLPPPGHVSIDRAFAGVLDLGVGDTVRIVGREFLVQEIHAGGNRLLQVAYLNAGDAREIFATPGRVGFYLLATTPGADLEAVARAATRAVPRSEARPVEEYARAFEHQISAGFLPVVGALVGIGILVGGAVVALTIYTATIERARDFGVLKAIGASGGFLSRIVIVQTLIVGVAGAVLGLAATLAIAPAIESRVPEFLTEVRLLDVAEVLAGALAMSVVSSWAPVHRINRIDPAMVFRA